MVLGLQNWMPINGSKMEKGINELTKDELQERIGELEQTYAELLAECENVNILNNIYREIKLMRTALQSLSN